MGIAGTYRDTKEYFEFIKKQMDDEVSRVFLAYVAQKGKVSKERAVPWYRMRVKKYRVGTQHLYITATGSGTYGYSHTSFLRIPLAWLDMEDEGLTFTIKMRIFEEWQDITRRIQRDTDRRKAETEKKERELLAELSKKYPGEVL